MSEASETPRDWKPISEAPRDGTTVYLKREEGAYFEPTSTYRWNKKYGMWMHEATHSLWIEGYSSSATHFRLA